MSIHKYVLHCELHDHWPVVLVGFSAYKSLLHFHVLNLFSFMIYSYSLYVNWINNELRKIEVASFIK